MFFFSWTSGSEGSLNIGINRSNPVIVRNNIEKTAIIER